ncbi:response regulator transcription factor [Azospirillum sp. TSO22-1]|uniref:winged helix-turn-helix domain-containing protein n=1 Tax=Azospirillum sp. TSO22-1 TaxID=716789 RepID=UPI000D6120FA|nr:response regulator transcription factor [Azospirillum sp. TSO22-1]PWC35161.1 cell division protein [Azospirillum sp. TSO22-1]
MKALLIEQDDLIAEAVGKQLALAKIMHDRARVHGAHLLTEDLRNELEGYDAIVIGSVPDSAEFVTYLRSLKTKAPIICLIERRCANTTVKILHAGADDVLVKPVVSAEIRARIEATQRRSHGHSTNAISVGRLTVYLDGRDPEIDGERLRLSQREHAILSVLALHHRRVVSKEHIYESVYGLSESEPLDKVIDVYICKLRKKIAGVTDGGRYIETVYGRGYKFEAPPEHAGSGEAEPPKAPSVRRQAKRPAMIPTRQLSRWVDSPLALHG